jgi:allantoicase
VITLDELNQCAATAFVRGLEGVFEHSPWVAERTAASRPFASRLDLLEGLRAAVAVASSDDQLALIRAHPKLASRGRAAADLTTASASEQRRAGLDACTAEDLRRLDELNAEYLATFEMPFILAVRGHDPKSIIGEAQRRLRNPAALERQRALQEIGLIAGFRLAERVTSPAGAEALAMWRRLAEQGDGRPLLREWMLAADLEISEDGESLIGRRRGAAAGASGGTVGQSGGTAGPSQGTAGPSGGSVGPSQGTAGPSGSAESTLPAAGLLESLVAIVVAQQLHQRRVRLPFDWVVVARHGQAQRGSPLPDAAALKHALQTVGAPWLQNTGQDSMHDSGKRPALVASHINMADPRLGAEALFATDDFFAPMARMLNPSPPEWRAGVYDDNGKWMDGWESRRRRDQGHDYCIVKLAAPCTLASLEIDTQYFTGNYPPYASVQACRTASAPDERTTWSELLPRSALNGNQRQTFQIESGEIWTHLKLNIFPDGGIARFRAYGTVHREWHANSGIVDLAAALNGGCALACSDEHYGSMHNLLLPGRGTSMADGWETRRRRGPGFDWVVVQLARPGWVHQVEVDTAYFKGNFPHQVSCNAALLREAPGADLAYQCLAWPVLLAPQLLAADSVARFDVRSGSDGPVSHVRVNMHPDGGMSRVRVFGRPDV